MEQMSETALLSYERTRLWLQSCFRVLGKGSRKKAALAAGKSPQQVSDLLHRRSIQPEELPDLQTWVQEEFQDRALTLPRVPAVSPDEETLLAYNKRRQSLALHFEQFGYGARVNAAHDLRVGPSRVSQVLSGKFYSPPLLERLETWAKEQTS